MTNKIFRSTVFVTVFVLVCSLALMVGFLHNHFTQVQIRQLKNELSLAVTGTEQYGNAFLENVEADRFRVTWIAQDGTVLFDTQVDQAAMENHADREEIREAFSLGEGSAVRVSATLTEQTFYEARQLSDGTVLRISTSQASAWMLMLGLLLPIALSLTLAILLSAILARRMARRIVEPLNKLDLDQPLQNDVYEEISPLLHRIHRQRHQIRLQMEHMQRKSDEFNQITSCMQEGLVLLDGSKKIISINPAAQKIFSIDHDCIGRDFLSMEDSPQIHTAISEALKSGHSITRQQRNGLEYQFDLSRIESNGAVIGAVILAFDITQQCNAEKMRREFSANVSHELKTPLQGIIGSAELLQSGMVREEDSARFIGHIHQEASRLVNLIEDIIRLSRLDEGVQLPTEQVDMLELAEEVKATLAPSIEQKQIDFRICGEGFQLQGVRRILQEMLFNLCDNAIKYNHQGGHVTICVENNAVSVSDSGIGIADEHKDRIFERFYRVDKSHSKASGGTGLGLSIVKHAAAYHNAAIHLESAPNEGTTITVQF